MEDYLYEEKVESEIDMRIVHLLEKTNIIEADIISMMGFDPIIIVVERKRNEININ